MLSFSTVKARVKAEQLRLLEEYGDPEMGRLQELVNQDVYPFDHDEIACLEPNSSCDVDRFQRDVRVVVKFTVHSVDLAKSQKPDYFFRMQSLSL